MTEEKDKAKASAPASDQENPLANMMVNILVPVVALSALSKTGDELWHLGPLKGMVIAVAFPALYGVWFLIKNRKLNFFSVLGVIGILLTGGITLYAWSGEGEEVKSNAAMLFAIKEAAIPLLLAFTIIGSHRTKKPLIELFLLNPDLLDIARIEKAVDAKDARPAYEKMRWSGTLMLAGSLVVSAVLNFILALLFLNGKATRVDYNAGVAKLTWVGYLVIGIPLMIIMMTGLFMLIKRIRKITGLGKDEVFLPR